MTFEHESIARAERQATAIGGSFIVATGRSAIEGWSLRATGSNELLIRLDVTIQPKERELLSQGGCR